MLSDNRVTLLQNGDAYFPALEAALGRAEREIYLESYIFQDDRTGLRIAEALKNASLRGVATHLLIDGFGSRHLSRTLLDYLKAAGVTVFTYRPRISPWTLQRRRLKRLHRKIAVIDLREAFVGGINIVDDTDAPDDPSPRFDFAVRVEGPLVQEIYKAVRRQWLRMAWKRRFRSTWKRRRTRLKGTPKPAGAMKAAFLVRDNFRHRRSIEEAYLRAIRGARKEVILANAYFLPGLNFRHALIAAARRGVRVVLLLQGKMEYRLLNYASRALYGSFLDAGIEIYEYHRSILHAKVAVVDGRWATVGSSNLDPFSLLLAREANVAVDDEAFGAELRSRLEQEIEKGARQISEKVWNAQPLGARLVTWLSYGLVRFLSGIAGYAGERSPETVDGSKTTPG